MDLKLKRNVLWKAIESVVTIAASFLQLAIIARFFDPTSVGHYQLVLAWLFLITALSCFGGIVLVSTRELSKCDDSALTEMAICSFCLWRIYRETGYLPWMKPQAVA